MTDTAEKIEEMIFEIESASRLKVSKLVIIQTLLVKQLLKMCLKVTG